MLSWRDTDNPEGGGAERYLEKMAAGMRDRGADVTIFAAAHDGPAEEVRDGIRFVRAGSKMSVYPQGMRALRSGRLGDADVVIDVQNGLPFFSRLVTRKPVIVLVHHVHREQWPVVYPGVTGRVGWFIERRAAPYLYRNCQYVAVSRATRDELVELGVDRSRIAVVHNGTDQVADSDTPKSPTPLLCTVGRLVPHKRVEHAIDVVRALRGRFPGLRLRVVGDGWWRDNLVAYARESGVADAVDFTGHVGEDAKSEIFASAWVQVLPSLKEGWGLVVGEAGMHGTPTIAYSQAGGTRESIENGRSGILVTSESELRDAVAGVLVSSEELARLSAGAREVAHQFTWEHAQESFAHVVKETLAGRTVSAIDPEPEVPQKGTGVNY